MNNLKICTYNIRYDNKQDENWNWEKRKTHIINLIENNKFDLLGVQEVLINQLNDLKANKKYDFFGVARGDGIEEDEFNGFFYNKKRLQKIDSGYFWLSKTPEKPSIYEDAGCKRVCVWAIFLDLISNEKFAFAVTHLDNFSENARNFSANLILEKLSPIYKEYPFALMGDFNSFTNEYVYKKMSENFKEVKVLANLKERETFTLDGEFLVNSNSKKIEIDFIFINNYLNLNNVKILKDSYNGKYLSDHFPITCNILKK